MLIKTSRKTCENEKGENQEQDRTVSKFSEGDFFFSVADVSSLCQLLPGWDLAICTSRPSKGANRPCVFQPCRASRQAQLMKRSNELGKQARRWSGCGAALLESGLEAKPWWAAPFQLPGLLAGDSWVPQGKTLGGLLCLTPTTWDQRESRWRQLGEPETRQTPVNLPLSAVV